MNHLIRVTTVLSPWADFSKIDPDVLAEAAARGTRAHTAFSNYALGRFVYVPDDCHGYLESYKRWHDEYIDQVLAVEVELICSVYGFYGHADLIAVIKGDADPTVIDWKTPIATQPLWKSQLAAYFHLAKPKYNPKRVASLRLKRDGSRALFDEYTSQAEDFAGFLAALSAYKFFKGE